MGDPGRIEDDPARIMGDPARIEGDPGRIGGDPARIEDDPARIMGDPAGIGGDPARIMDDPARIEGDPGRIVGDPAGINICCQSNRGKTEFKIKDIVAIGGEKGTHLDEKVSVFPAYVERVDNVWGGESASGLFSLGCWTLLRQCGVSPTWRDKSCNNLVEIGAAQVATGEEQGITLAGISQIYLWLFPYRKVKAGFLGFSLCD